MKNKLNISVFVACVFKGKVCGLCGDFDGSQNNDLLSSSNQMEVDAADFGNSWKVRPSCADAVPVGSWHNSVFLQRLGT